MVILGIDPGLNATGFGVLEASPAQLRVIAGGDIRPPRTQPLAARLECIHTALSRLIRHHHPDVVVLEKLFTHHHHVTTVALIAHARGVACLAAQEHGLPLAEYPATQVKKSLTGSGAASKEQVSHMVGQWLDYADPSWTVDATDALALAIVHAHSEAHRQHLPAGAISR